MINKIFELKIQLDVDFLMKRNSLQIQIFAFMFFTPPKRKSRKNVKKNIKKELEKKHQDKAKRRKQKLWKKSIAFDSKYSKFQEIIDENGNKRMLRM